MIQFWSDEQHVNAMKAIGASPTAGPAPECSLVVGDFITFPGFPHQAFRVVSRLFRSGPQPKWYVQLEPAASPM